MVLCCDWCVCIILDTTANCIELGTLLRVCMCVRSEDEEEEDEHRGGRARVAEVEEVIGRGVERRAPGIEEENTDGIEGAYTAERRPDRHISIAVAEWGVKFLTRLLIM